MMPVSTCTLSFLTSRSAICLAAPGLNWSSATISRGGRPPPLPQGPLPPPSIPPPQTPPPFPPPFLPRPRGVLVGGAGIDRVASHDQRGRLPADLARELLDGQFDA